MDAPVKIGLLGGTFDPVHNGHIRIAKIAREQLGLNEIWFMPNGNPPHKRALASAKDRWQMLGLALDGISGLKAIDIELKAQKTAYTVDTMAKLKAEFPEREFTYIMGADAYLRLDGWKRFEELPSLFNVAVFARKDNELSVLKQKADQLKEKHGLISHILAVDSDDISSEYIRFRAARHLDITELVPAAVGEYIEANGIYKDDSIERLISTLAASRWEHTLGVEATAVDMAKRFGCDETKAGEAALLHDCAKSIKDTQQLIEICKRGNVTLSDEEIRSREVLHAPAGAVLAHEEYGVNDAEVLSAIRWHTTGHVGMTLLEKIVYVADMIEPGRKGFDGIDQIRESAKIDIDKAVIACAENTLRYVRSKGITPDSRTLEMINEIKNRK